MKITLNERMKELMEERNLNAYSMSKEIDLSDVSILHILKTNAPIRYNHLIKLAEFFDCSLDFFCGRTNIPEPYQIPEEFLFPSRLRELLLEKKLTVTKIAKELQTGRTTLQVWLRGIRPTSASLILLADYFNCSIDHLLGA